MWVRCRLWQARSLGLLAFAAHALCRASRAHAETAECAPTQDVNQALARTEKLASQELGETEAVELLRRLTEKGVVIGGKVCFLTADFAAFGHIVADFFAHHLKVLSRQKSGGWKPSFDKTNRDDSVAKSKCRCSSCPSKHLPWCSSKKPKPGCCPHYCSSIFSAISVGALSGLKISGIDACCDEGALKCSRSRPKGSEPNSTSQRVRGKPRGSKKPAKKKTPNFNFTSGKKGGKSKKSDDEDIVFGVDESTMFSQPENGNDPDFEAASHHEDEPGEPLETSDPNQPSDFSIESHPPTDSFFSETDVFQQSFNSTPANSNKEGAKWGGIDATEQQQPMTSPTVTSSVFTGESEGRKSDQNSVVGVNNHNLSPTVRPSQTATSQVAPLNDNREHSHVSSHKELSHQDWQTSEDVEPSATHSPSTTMRLSPSLLPISLATPGIDATQNVDTESSAPVTVSQDSSFSSWSELSPAWPPRNSAEDREMMPSMTPVSALTATANTPVSASEAVPMPTVTGPVMTESVVLSSDVAEIVPSTAPDDIEDLPA